MGSADPKTDIVNKNSSKLSKDIRIIIKTFFTWRIFLFALALSTPIRYDTSSQFIITAPTRNILDNILSQILNRFVTWDSLYFVEIACRGYRYEHEWAFGYGWTRLLRLVGGSTSPTNVALMGLVLCNACQLGAALVLYCWTRLMILDEIKNNPAKSTRLENFPLLTGLLFILSPSGIFLSAIYAESPFALLSFAGGYYRQRKRYIPAGLCWGLCCLIRANGLLWGLVLVWDMLEASSRILTRYLANTSRARKSNIRIIGKQWSLAGNRLDKDDIKLVVIIAASTCLVIAGFLYPQVLAYLKFCIHCQGSPRSWCLRPLPLMYGYVQETYWNMGFMRYWTPNNIPNFLFALPTLLLMAVSLNDRLRLSAQYRALERFHLTPYYVVTGTMLISALLLWHVQIITRVASCLPNLYWSISGRLLRESGSNSSRKFTISQLFIYYIALWVPIQTVLFAAFLPPA